jgi:hypothetical protein
LRYLALGREQHRQIAPIPALRPLARIGAANAWPNIALRQKISQKPPKIGIVSSRFDLDRLKTRVHIRI